MLLDDQWCMDVWGSLEADQIPPKTNKIYKNKLHLICLQYNN